MDDGMGLHERGLWERIEGLQQALAEKDREIAQWKAAHAEMVARNKLLRDRPDLPADRIRAHDEWVIKYQQLMEKAVRFAQAIYDPNVIDNDPIYVEAQAFLKERENDAKG